LEFIFTLWENPRRITATLFQIYRQWEKNKKKFRENLVFREEELHCGNDINTAGFLLKKRCNSDIEKH